MKVLIVDDDPLLARSLATILAAEPDIDVVGLGFSGPEAVEAYTASRPDVLLLDIQMPAGDGLTAAERILRLDAQARIVLLTTFSDDEYIVRALRMGVRGYLIKQDVAQIAPALRSVMAGVSVLEGQVLERTARLGISAGTPSARGVRPPVFAPLTEREYEVVEAVCEGLDNSEVADRLHLSEGTVRNHISTVLAKLGLRNRTQIAVLYYRPSRLP
ncbi:DNA-binding response regulator, NarL/FixJ family, contains REC and HTH domains [Actinomyces ruminicola]|uniref:DNA-binding response regulator, NarL/FixJ family, contains REC and HTH domains n=1 Tax=Actinomyces ruminicola TaxID=332524 RepID=A0A1G9ZZ50_9ACTO|nr:response regulator transcription factor [Actinomyces ruminicola]SDN26334.1 DNA-binding response regulator, NarL/FixJ family, contains REC and HTH domains [Actinomyces ruminicola]